MNQQKSSLAREQTIHRYVQALDVGNLDEVTAVLQIAENDADLDQIIIEINNAYAEELILTTTAQDAEKVRSLLQAHLSSARQDEEIDVPLTVSEVAARLISDRSIPESDQEWSLKLLHVHVALPNWLSLAEIRKLGGQLSIQASERFWKIFRNAAIQMSMGRGQAQMAATRRKHSYQTKALRERNSNEERNDQ